MGYQPSSMLSHRQNLHALRGWQHTGCGEAQSHELIKSIKTVPVEVFLESSITGQQWVGFVVEYTYTYNI
jgi:hypothetical protein